MNEEELSKAKKRFQFQRWNSRRRKDRLGKHIEWHLTFEQWLEIWLSSGHYQDRGVGANKYVMSRKCDLGNYEIGNIEIKLASENTIEGNILNPGRRLGHTTPQEIKDKISQKLKGRKFTKEHLHNMSLSQGRPVMTPEGKFDSKKLAEKTLKIDFGYRSKKYPDKYYYIK